MLSSYAVILCLLFAHVINTQSTGVSCPINEPTNGFYRLGQSRFYIKVQPQGGFPGNVAASDFCKSKQLRLASINDLTESIYVGRELEALIFKQRQLRNNLFYLSSRYDEVRATYVGKQTEAAIQYQNIHYFPPNELGRGQNAAFANKSLCLVFGPPYPVAPEAGSANGIYGWSSSMIEWPCADNVVKGNKKRFKLGALCETVDPNCDKMLESSYDLDLQSYKGLFPLANRRFVLSWDQMNQEEAVNFCMNYQLTLYTPTEGDQCLLPYIKDHFPDVTTTSFWTSAKYNKHTQMLKYDDGTEKEMKLMKTPRAGDSDEDTCTSMSYTNERNDQMTKCKCRWNMMAQAVTNCNMPAGVICQHKDFASRLCLRNKEGRLAQEYVTALGDSQKRFFRSVRKQEHKRALARCKELKYELVSRDSEIFQGSYVLDNLISYDLQTYWLANPVETPPSLGGPESVLPTLSSAGECAVAILEGKQGFSNADFETRNCVEKNFFICEDKSVLN